MASIKAWIKAARLRTLPLATTCVMIGGALGFSKNPDASPLVLGLAAFVVMKLQILANFANDYGDFIKGTDGENRPDRALASGDITPSEMRVKMIFNSVVIFLAGCTTVWLAFRDSEVNLFENLGAISLVVLGVSGIVAAFKYTMGKSAYGYRGMGDLFVLLFFGYIGVLGIAFLMCGEIETSWILPATFSGLSAVAVLNLNNMRDIDGDREAGKNTLVVKIGLEKSKLYHTIIVLIAWGSLLYFLKDKVGFMWFALMFIIAIRHIRVVREATLPEHFDPELKKVAILSFIVGMFMLMQQTIQVAEV
ncbi:MAG: 1,4-dihydroxy-2-naphthoate octaprenyltransferase [Crocinitomicaceae bacterium]|nr:1,4-dihydroxy-2-naphthoate octaprenyltransferase [Crocinitomicaceae bacterium]|tara:strand:- start:5459 stop:6379 length:921 start_codon:yes stop_codon:yes gene_type:complete